MGRLLAVVAVGAALLAADDTKGQKGKRSEPMPRTITGCVDQSGETYILAKEGTMERIAVLKGRTFTDDNFARFIGQKVKVTGDTDDGTIHVDRIEKIADTCR